MGDRFIEEGVKDWDSTYNTQVFLNNKIYSSTENEQKVSCYLK